MLAMDVERMTEEALANGVVSPNEALRELRNSLNRRASDGIIARLQLDAGVWTRTTPALIDAAEAAAKIRAQRSPGAGPGAGTGRREATHVR